MLQSICMQNLKQIYSVVSYYSYVYDFPDFEEKYWSKIGEFDKEKLFRIEQQQNKLLLVISSTRPKTSEASLNNNFPDLPKNTRPKSIKLIMGPFCYFTTFNNNNKNSNQKLGSCEKGRYAKLKNRYCFSLLH